MNIVPAILVLSAAIGVAMPVDEQQFTSLPVSAPIEADSAGKSGATAMQSVMRVLCPKEGTSGTGFLHKSRRIITAAHVVSGCSQIVVLASTGEPVSATVTATDVDLDLAILDSTPPLKAKPLEVSKKTEIAIGSQVSTWGFPGGYGGRAPLLSVGYLAGQQALKQQSGMIITQWVVNAAFNSGNSGGPLIDVDSGDVVGVVSSKLAPISPNVNRALEALENQKSGFTYSATRPDGTKISVSEGQVIGMVLKELRSQVQLVIGQAVLLDDLRRFLKAHGVEA